MKNATVAIVEDETDLREAVVEFLSLRGLHVYGLPSAAAFREFFSQRSVDLVVLDIAMSGESGVSLARWLLARSSAPAILFATASGRPTDRILGLEIGADDYIVKPYDLHELLARIRSILRRPQNLARGRTAALVERHGNTIPFGAFVLDLAARQVRRRDGSVVGLTSAEVDLLELLVKRPHRVLTRTQILELGHARPGRESARAIDVRIARLRRKLEANCEGPGLIRTIRGEGYVFEPQED